MDQGNVLMTVREVAEMMRMNDRTILKMAQRGEIPAAKIARRWRFDRDMVTAWLQSHMQLGEERGTARAADAMDVTCLSCLMRADLISLDLLAVTRDGVLKELVGLVEDAGLLTDPGAFLASLIGREDLLSTALGAGVAVPHARSVPDKLFLEPAIAIGRSRHGVEFDSPDGKLTHLFFLICPPDDAIHLRLLAKLAEVVREDALIRELMKARDAESVIKAVKAEEKRRNSIEGL